MKMATTASTSFFTKGRIIFVIVYCVIISALYLIIYGLSGTQAANSARPLIAADKNNADYIFSTTDTTTQFSTLKAQYTVLSLRKEHHFMLSVSFYRYYFTFNILLIFLSSIATLIVFFIAKDGWDNTNSYIKYTLSLSIFFASLFYLMPNFLQNNANLKNNMNQYGKYNEQQTESVHWLYKYKTSNPHDIAILDTIIEHNFEMLSKNQTLYFEMDNSKINTDPFEKFGK